MRKTRGGSRTRRRRRKRQRRTHHKKRRVRRRKRGGYSGIRVPLSPANFQGPSQPTLPPYGPVTVPVPGITKVARQNSDQQYYYAKNNRVMGNPTSTYSTWGPKSQTGGRKRRRKKKRRRRTRKRRRRRKQRGGTTSSVINAIPFGTDLRDAYWRTGNRVTNLWDSYNGFPGRMSTAAAVQPIGIDHGLPYAAAPALSSLYQDGSNQAASPSYQAYNNTK